MLCKCFSNTRNIQQVDTNSWSVKKVTLYMQNVWVKNVFAKSLCISAVVVLYAETFSIEDWKFQNKVNEKLMPTNTLDYNINGNSLKIAKFNSKFYFVFYKWFRKSQYFNYYKVMHKRIFIFYVFFLKKGLFSFYQKNK